MAVTVQLSIQRGAYFTQKGQSVRG
jgi:hypothetical protein